MKSCNSLLDPHDDQIDSMTQMLHWHRTREEYVTNLQVTFVH